MDNEPLREYSRNEFLLYEFDVVIVQFRLHRAQRYSALIDTCIISELIRTGNGNVNGLMKMLMVMFILLPNKSVIRFPLSPSII